MSYRFYLHSMVAIATTLLVSMGCSNSPEIATGEVTGTITINGVPTEGVSLSFVPEASIRPSLATTDKQGKYKAKFISSQSGVALGPCVVEFSIYRGNSPKNYLPKKFNVNAAQTPDFHLDITEKGMVFDYDIVYDGEVPPL